jgi:site-specific recombinase XerD
MMLSQLITQYIHYRQSLGEKFRTNEYYLKAFCKLVESNTDIQSISLDIINNFLYGNTQTVTSSWFAKHAALSGFYQYALTRNYVTKVPLPSILPKRPQAFIPYIYSQNELKLLFDTALTYQKNKSCILPYTVQTALILTYVLGLRIHETLSLTLQNIDMENAVITIEQSKFYKSRLVPFNIQVKDAIAKYLAWRIDQRQPQSLESPLFIGKNAQEFNINTMQYIFQRIRAKANIKRDDTSRYQPRIHDLRHSFAVHRLTSWYREKKDVQQLLPILSTYIGHKCLADTTVYLTMTDDLLHEANIRFEEYTIGEKQ